MDDPPGQCAREARYTAFDFLKGNAAAFCGRKCHEISAALKEKKSGGPKDPGIKGEMPVQNADHHPNLVRIRAGVPGSQLG